MVLSFADTSVGNMQVRSPNPNKPGARKKRAQELRDRAKRLIATARTLDDPKSKSALLSDADKLKRRAAELLHPPPKKSEEHSQRSALSAWERKKVQKLRDQAVWFRRAADAAPTEASREDSMRQAEELESEAAEIEDRKMRETQPAEAPEQAEVSEPVRSHALNLERQPHQDSSSVIGRGRGKYTLEPGMRFGRLTLVEEVSQKGSRRSLIECLCDCGNTVVVRRDKLTSGETKSCGCLAREMGTQKLRDATSNRLKLEKRMAEMNDVVLELKAEIDRLKSELLASKQKINKEPG